MPYSNDLRLRVLAAVDGGVPVRQVAALLRVSVSYTTGGGPNEGMDAPPPAINLDTIAGCALLAMPRRSRRRSACAANAVLVVIPARGGHHLVQTA